VVSAFRDGETVGPIRRALIFKAQMKRALVRVIADCLYDRKGCLLFPIALATVLQFFVDSMQMMTSFSDSDWSHPKPEISQSQPEKHSQQAGMNLITVLENPGRSSYSECTDPGRPA